MSASTKKAKTGKVKKVDLNKSALEKLESDAVVAADLKTILENEKHEPLDFGLTAYANYLLGWTHRASVHECYSAMRVLEIVARRFKQVSEVHCRQVMELLEDMTDRFHRLRLLNTGAVLKKVFDIVMILLGHCNTATKDSSIYNTRRSALYDVIYHSDISVRSAAVSAVVKMEEIDQKKHAPPPITEGMESIMSQLDSLEARICTNGIFVPHVEEPDREQVPSEAETYCKRLDPSQLHALEALDLTLPHATKLKFRDRVSKRVEFFEGSALESLDLILPKCVKTVNKCDPQFLQIMAKFEALARLLLLFRKYHFRTHEQDDLELSLMLVGDCLVFGRKSVTDVGIRLDELIQNQTEIFMSWMGIQPHHLQLTGSSIGYRNKGNVITVAGCIIFSTKLDEVLLVPPWQYITNMCQFPQAIVPQGFWPVTVAALSAQRDASVNDVHIDNYDRYIDVTSHGIINRFFIATHDLTKRCSCPQSSRHRISKIMNDSNAFERGYYYNTGVAYCDVVQVLRYAILVMLGIKAYGSVLITFQGAFNG